MHRILTMSAVVIVCTGVLACQSTRPPPQQVESRPKAAPAITSEQMEEVEQVLQRGLNSLNQHCYQPELQRHKDSQGETKDFEVKVTAKILVGMSGKATQVEYGESDLGGAFLQCIGERIRGWDFPRLPEPSWFTYPVSFSPAY